jgi:hypothetical protein
MQIHEGPLIQRVTIPAIGRAAGYVIPDFAKGLGGFSGDIFSISPTNYDLAPVDGPVPQALRLLHGARSLPAEDHMHLDRFHRREVLTLLGDAHRAPAGFVLSPAVV